MALFPQSKEQLRFAMSKAITRAPRRGSTQGAANGATGGSSACSARRAARARPSRPATSPSRSRWPARRCSSSTSTCSSATSGSASGLPPEKTMYDLAVSGGSLDEDKLHDYVMTARHGGRGPARAGPARSGERDHHRAAPRRPRRGARHVRLRHRGHAARVHRRGHRHHRRELRSRDGGHARLALAEEHQARPRDPRSHGLRPEEDPARAQPGGHPRRHQPARRRRRARERAQHLHSLRPRDPALGQRGHSRSRCPVPSRTPRRRSTTSRGCS